MSEQPTFSLAVVRGLEAGRTLRSARKRISVGSARDNDLVLRDPNVAPRHFLVLIDGARWRVHSLTGKDVDVDRRWVHPSNGRRGALIRASGWEVLLFPGTLDQRTVDTEVAKRAGVEDADEMATSINLPKIALEDPNEPTVAVRAVNAASAAAAKDAAAKDAELDLVEMAAMPTIAGERPPDALREAAQQMLEQRRGSTGSPPTKKPVAPSVLRESTGAKNPVDPLANHPVQGDLPAGQVDERTVGLEWSGPANKSKERGRSKWDRARRSAPAPAPSAGPSDSIPEILATPESQIMPVPGASKSVMSARPDFAAPSEREAEVIPIADEERGGRRGRGTPTPSPQPATSSSGSSKKNAWGDPSARALVPTRDDDAKRNAWGDGSNKKQKKKRSGWGDASGRSGARPAEPAPASPPPSAHPSAALSPRGPPSANHLDLAALSRGDDAALEILTHPDGAYATQVRLLGARIEDFAKRLGYRAYMVSSPEPLTGKTTAACNLAFALAEDTQRRIALVEANFRYPRFAEIFGLDERTGLISVLEGRARLQDVGFKLSDRNLLILPAGGRHTTPAEVLASPRFKALIAELADTVDIALIDAPSVTPFADANLILPLVDAAFLVVAERQTRRSWLGRALAQLGETRVLGSLFNRIPPKTLKKLEKERKERLRAKP